MVSQNTEQNGYRAPGWVQPMSMYAGAYLVVRAAKDFLEGANREFVKAGRPEEMRMYITGMKAVVEHAVEAELEQVRRQASPEERIAAAAEMESLIEYRSALAEENQE